jgi:hypothetical protein
LGAYDETFGSLRLPNVNKKRLKSFGLRLSFCTP